MRTPISITSGGRSAEAGFTLIELLAVLAILAIAIASFTMNGSRGLDTARLRALMVHTVAAIGQARADAMRGMTEKIFYIDVPHRRLSYPASGQILDVPSGIDLKVIVAAAERYKDGSVGIRFYPNGGSTGGEMTFTFRGQSYEIRVNWLTGNASLTRV